MKKLISGILMCVVLFSCKKESKILPVPSGVEEIQKYGISFNLKDFTPEIIGVKNKQTSDVPLKDKAEYLCYIAFNEEGKEVSRIRQFAAGGTIAYRYGEYGISDEYNPGDWPFGTFTDSLAAGDYTIVIIASQGRFGINSHNDEAAGLPVKPLASAGFIYWYVLMENWSRAKDTFYKKFQLKVEDKEMTEEVVLERIVAKAEINILDAKPNEGYRFQFINEYLGMGFADNTFFGRADDTDLGAAEVTRENTKFSSFILNTDPAMPIDIVIEAYQPPNYHPIATKTIKGVPFFKNKRTVLTGNFYPTTGAIGFAVKVCDEWDQDTVNVSF